MWISHKWREKKMGDKTFENIYIPKLFHFFYTLYLIFECSIWLNRYEIFSFPPHLTRSISLFSLRWKKTIQLIYSLCCANLYSVYCSHTHRYRHKIKYTQIKVSAIQTQSHGERKRGREIERERMSERDREITKQYRNSLKANNRKFSIIVLVQCELCITYTVH